MGPSPMGKGGDSTGMPRAAAAAALQQQQQQQQQQRQKQQAGGSGEVPTYLVLPNVSGGLANGGMQLELPPFMGAAHPPNGSSPYLHPPTLGGLPPVGSVLSNMAAASSQQPSLSEGGEGQAGKKRRGPRPRLFKKHACQCDGCPVDLAPLSFYLQRCGSGSGACWLHAIVLGHMPFFCVLRDTLSVVQGQLQSAAQCGCCSLSPAGRSWHAAFWWRALEAAPWLHTIPSHA